jgi:uncharacterized protein with WD repeat
MTVDFYRDNEQKAPTVANYLFTDYYALMINGQRIEHEFKIYEVTGQLWADDNRKLLNVFLYEFTPSDTQYLIDATWSQRDLFRHVPEKNNMPAATNIKIDTIS